MSNVKYSLPQYTERYEYIKIDPEVKFSYPSLGDKQELRQGVRFQINDRSGIYDHANAYFNMDFHVENQATGVAPLVANRIDVLCGSQAFIQRLVVENSNGDTIYECSDVNKASYVKKLLTQSRDYAETVAEDEFWYLDNDRTPTSTGHVTRFTKLSEATREAPINVKIPLRNFSFFESLDYNNILLSGMQLAIILDITTDNNLLYKTSGNVDLHRVIIDKFELWTPLCVLRPQYLEAYNNSISGNNKLMWNYLRETVRYNRFQTQSDSWRISGIVNPKKLIYFFLVDQAINDQLLSTQHFDSMFVNDNNSGIGTNAKLSSARVEVGADNVFYPRSDYKYTELSRIYSDVIKYAHIDGSTKETGLELSRSLFKNMYSMLYFDLDFSKERLVTDTTDIVLHFTLDVAPLVASRVYAVILFENEATFSKIDGNFMVSSTNVKS